MEPIVPTRSRTLFGEAEAPTGAIAEPRAERNSHLPGMANSHDGGDSSQPDHGFTATPPCDSHAHSDSSCSLMLSEKRQQAHPQRQLIAWLPLLSDEATGLPKYAAIASSVPEYCGWNRKPDKPLFYQEHCDGTRSKGFAAPLRWPAWRPDATPVWETRPMVRKWGGPCFTAVAVNAYIPSTLELSIVGDTIVDWSCNDDPYWLEPDLYTVKRWMRCPCAGRAYEPTAEAAESKALAALHKCHRNCPLRPLAALRVRLVHQCLQRILGRVRLASDFLDTMLDFCPMLQWPDYEYRADPALSDLRYTPPLLTDTFIFGNDGLVVEGWDVACAPSATLQQHIPDGYTRMLPGLHARGVALKSHIPIGASGLPGGCGFVALCHACWPQGPVEVWGRLAELIHTPGCPINHWEGVSWQSMEAFCEWAELPVNVAILSFKVADGRGNAFPMPLPNLPRGMTPEEHELGYYAQCTAVAQANNLAIRVSSSLMVLRYHPNAPTLLFLPPDAPNTVAHWLAVEPGIMPTLYNNAAQPLLAGSCARPGGAPGPFAPWRVNCATDCSPLAINASTVPAALLWYGKMTLNANWVGNQPPQRTNNPFISTVTAVPYLRAHTATPIFGPLPVAALQPLRVLERPFERLQRIEENRRQMMRDDEIAAWGHLLAELQAGVTRIEGDESDSPAFQQRQQVDYRMNYWYVGAVPPPCDTVCPHWCSAGHGIGLDSAVLGKRNMMTTCNCKVGFFLCRHFYVEWLRNFFLCLWLTAYSTLPVNMLRLLILAITTPQQVLNQLQAVAARPKVAAAVFVFVFGVLFLAMLGGMLAAAGPVLLYCTWDWIKRSRGHQRALRVCYTHYTDHPRAADYVVPTSRFGWQAVASVTDSSLLNPTGRKVTWADYDKVEYVTGMRLAPPDHMASSCFTARDCPSGYQVATCTGLWPTGSTEHTKEPVTTPDPFTMLVRDARCEYSTYSPGHVAGAPGPTTQRLGLALLLLMALMFVADAAETATKYLLPFLFPFARTHLRLLTIFLQSSLSHWLLASLALSQGLALFILAVARMGTHLMENGDLIFGWNQAIALSAAYLLYLFAVEFGVEEYEHLSILIAAIAHLTILPLQRRNWKRVTRAMQMSHFLHATRVPEPGKTFTRLMNTWDRMPETLMPRVRDCLIATQHDYASNHDGYRWLDTGIIDAAAWLCAPFRQCDFAHQMKSIAKKAKATWEWSNEHGTYAYRYTGRICARPGCGEQRTTGKWPHGLCPRCTRDKLVVPDAGPGASYARGWDACGSEPIVYPRYVALPEVELPLSSLELQPEVCFYTQPGFQGRHKPPCPLATLHHVPPPLVRKMMKGKATCQCGKEALGASPEPRPTRIAGYLAGFGVNRLAPMVNAKTLTNLMRAVAARIARLRPFTPKQEAWDLASHLTSHPAFFPDLDSLQVPSLSVEEWLAGFLPSRGAVLTRCYETWESCGRIIDYGTHRFRVFLKREWVPNTEPRGPIMQPLLTNKPRTILPPYGSNPALADVAHIIAGPALRAILHEVKKLWHRDHSIFYASATPQDLDDWLNANQGAGMWLWSDYTMYDMTHHTITWEFLEPIFLRALGRVEDLDRFKQVLKGWRAPQGKGFANVASWSAVLRFYGIAMNASGRDDTALANAILNGFAMVLSLTAAHCGKPLLQVVSEDITNFTTVAKVALVGDDVLAALPPATTCGPWLDSSEVIKNNLAQFGFIAKVGMSPRIVDAVFLGCRPYRVAGSWRWGPTLGRRLYKHHACINPQANLTSWLHGICRMERDHLGFVPILGAMARRACQLLEGAKLTPWHADIHHGMKWDERRAPTMPDDDTYLHCALAYTTSTGALTVGDILATEALIMTATELPAIISTPAIDRVLMHDDL